MIALIADEISETIFYQECSFEEAANIILNIIEKEGMLPPKNPNKYDRVPTVTPTGNHDYSFIREWEPES